VVPRIRRRVGTTKITRCFVQPLGLCLGSGKGRSGKGKAESNNKLDICLICGYSKVDDQVHTRAVCFGI
ncbi:MAG: hypothetical protein AAB403_05585, partial [Planctomycetota bacterium]